MTPTEIIMTALTAAGGSAVIVAGLAAWLGKVWADRIAQTQKLMQEIDIDLRTKRIGVYEELWRSTAILPKWPKATGVTYEQLLLFSESLRTWYFQKGGMYLSFSTHKNAYGPLQDALADVLRTRTSAQCPMKITRRYGVAAAHCARRSPGTSNPGGRASIDMARPHHLRLTHQVSFPSGLLVLHYDVESAPSAPSRRRCGA